MNTSCKDCVFAAYDEKTQVGCVLGRIDKYRTVGAKVDECCDDEKEFFVIRDRVCMFCRDENSPWAKAKKPKEYEAAARKEAEIKLLTLVAVDADKYPLDTVVKTVASLDKQKLKPAQVIVVINDDTKASDVVAALQPFTCNWLVKKIVERNKDGSRVGPGRLIDLAVEAEKGHNWYALFVPGYEVPENFTLDLNKALIDRLERFSLLISSNGMVVQSACHSALGGNRASIVSEDEEPPAGWKKGQQLNTLAEKILYYADCESCQHMIKDVEEICPTI